MTMVMNPVELCKLPEVGKPVELYELPEPPQKGKNDKDDDRKNDNDDYDHFLHGEQHALTPPSGEDRTDRPTATLALLTAKKHD